jgi:hypothetical protein
VSHRKKEELAGRDLVTFLGSASMTKRIQG